MRAGAKSVFHFDVPGSVAKSTHAGLPWLRYIRLQAPSVHFWPFDGWDVPSGRSVVAEVYPSLWSRSFAREGRNEHQHDAFSVAEWMRRSDLDGTLAGFLFPALAPAEREAAHIEAGYWELDECRDDLRSFGAAAITESVVTDRAYDALSVL